MTEIAKPTETSVEIGRRAKIGIIGAGWWATEIYIPAVMQDAAAELVAVNRRDGEALRRILEVYPGLRGYQSHDEMLVAESLDGVIIASPHTLHHAHAAAAINAGAHALIDKPMTTSAADARDLVGLADRRGVNIVIPFGWNFAPFVTVAAEAIRSRRIGDPTHIACHLASPTRALFSGDGSANSEGHMFQPAASTWSDPASAGGFGWGQLSHALGLLFRLIDVAPVSVTATRTLSPTGVDLCNAAILSLSNGGQATLSGTALLPKHATRQMDVRIFGTEGAVFLDMERPRLEIRRFDRDDTEIPLMRNAGTYDTSEAVRRFCSMCRDGKSVGEADGLIGLRTVEVLESMYRSFQSGQWESIAPANDQKGRIN